MNTEFTVAAICDHLGRGLAKTAEGNVYATVFRILLQVMAQKTESIDRKVGRLLEGPYKTGLDFLKDAKTATSRSERLERIGKGCDKFCEAAAQLEGSMKSRAHFYAGVCYDLRREHLTAVARYEDAFSAAMCYEMEAWKESTRPRRTGARVGLGGAVASAPLTVIGGGILAMFLTGGAAAPFLAGAALGGALSASLPSAGRGVGGFFARRRQGDVITFHKSFVRPLAALLIQRGVPGEILKSAAIVHNGGIPWVKPTE